jgi:hypothetical protein
MSSANKSPARVLSGIGLMVATAATLGALISLPALAIPISGQGTWETTLQPRDIDGNGSVDAFYDTTLNITWLANFRTLTGLVSKVDWDTANRWATTTSFFGLSGWRLPTTNDTGRSGCQFSYSGSDCGFNVDTSTGNPVNSELAHLFYVTLGNLADCDKTGSCGVASLGVFSTGNLTNYSIDGYWSGTAVALDSNFAWYFGSITFPVPGYQGTLRKDVALRAVAVHPGDVGTPMPLPSTAALIALAFVRWVLFGAGGLAGRVRRLG